MQCCREFWIRCIRIPPHSLRLSISLNNLHTMLITPCKAQIIQSFFINWEETTRRPIFRRHIRNRRLIRQRQMIQPFTIKFHKFSNHAKLTQHLNNAQHKIRRRRPFLHLSGNLKSNHFRNKHRNRLPQHRGLGFNPANTPTKHRQPIHHRRMRVRPNQRIRINHPILFPHSLRDIFQIHLMANPRPRRHNAKILKRPLPPFQKLVTLAIALELPLHIRLKRLRRPKFIHHHRMVNHQINRHNRINLLRIAPKALHRLPHRRQIHHGRHTRKILHQHTGRAIRNLMARTLFLLPIRQRLNILSRHRTPIFKPQQILQKHLQSVRKPRNIPNLIRCFTEVKVSIILPLNAKCRFCPK